ncbi:MAG: radical SAM protein [Candidatus Methanofastidiosia archaeon]
MTQQIELHSRTREDTVFIMQLSVTGRCNLRCTHCYDDTEDHQDMPVENCEEVLDQFFALCCQWRRSPVIWLTGGEPTLHPHFWHILDYIKIHSDLTDVHSVVAVLSNGINFTDEFVKRLEEHPLHIYVQISLDGARAETHDAIRGKGSFDKAVGALKLLKPTAVETHIHFVVHKDNYEDAFTMPDLARVLGANVLTVTRLVPWGRGKELYEKMLTSEQVKNLFKNLSDDLDEIMAADSSPETLISRARCDWPVIYPDPSTPEASTKNGFKCGVGLSYINIQENGDVYPCRRMPIKIGNVFEEDLITIWQHPLLWKFRRKHRFVKGKCEQCFFNVKAPSICSGGASCIAYACGKDPFQPDPQCPVNPSEGPAGVEKETHTIHH